MTFPESHRALSFCLRMIFSENRDPPRIKCGAGFFRIMRLEFSLRDNPLRQKLNSHLVSELTKAEEETRVG